MAVILDSVLGHSLFTSWQGEVEGTALNQSTLNPNTTPLLLHDTMANRQAQTSALIVARVGGINLLKAFKDCLEFISGDASPLIFNLE